MVVVEAGEEGVGGGGPTRWRVDFRMSLLQRCIRSPTFMIMELGTGGAGMKFPARLGSSTYMIPERYPTDY